MAPLPGNGVPRVPLGVSSAIPPCPLPRLSQDKSAPHPFFRKTRITQPTNRFRFRFTGDLVHASLSPSCVSSPPHSPYLLTDHHTSLAVRVRPFAPSVHRNASGPQLEVVCSTMAAAIRGCTVDERVKTPGFFTAAINADGGDPFEQSFVAGMATREDFNVSQYQETQYLHLATQGSFSPIVDFSKPQQYPNPLFQSHLLSPPVSAKQSPPNWPNNKFSHQQPPKPTVISTQYPSQFQYHLQHGQATPPDDRESDDFGMKNSHRQPDEHNRHGHHEQPQGEPTNGGKRKRASTWASEPDDATNGTKRSRKFAPSTAGPIETMEDPIKPDDDKRSKFLERNRVAASKCRQKKKEWTSNLEATARELQKRNGALMFEVASIREEVMWLKGQLLKHMDCGSEQIREYLAHEAELIAHADRRPYSSSRSAASPVGKGCGSRIGRLTSTAQAKTGSRRSRENGSRSPTLHYKSESRSGELLTNPSAHDGSGVGNARHVRR